VDVRRPGEWQSGHIAQAVLLPLNELEARAEALDRERPVVAMCAGGYRSAIATSVLERLGFRKITNVVGGMAAWNAAKLEVSTQ
jgi:rhodanese-related sulfurtransferase